MKTPLVGRMVRRTIDETMDAYLNIRTIPRPEDLRSSDAFKQRHPTITGIGTVNYLNLWRTQHLVQPTCDDVIFDMGSGTGRVVCWFGRMRVRKVVGIEVIPSCADISKENAERLRGRRSPIEIIKGDFLEADISTVTIMFLFNPCDENTFRQLYMRIKDSLQKHPRRLVIYYHNPVHHRVLDEDMWLSSEHKMFGEYTGMLYQPAAEKNVRQSRT